MRRCPLQWPLFVKVKTNLHSVVGALGRSGAWSWRRSVVEALGQGGARSWRRWVVEALVQGGARSWRRSVNEALCRGCFCLPLQHLSNFHILRD